MKIKIVLIFISVIVNYSNLYSQQMPTWQKLTNAPVNSAGKFEDIFFINPQVGWLVGLDYPHHKSFIFKTTNGGTNWIDESFDINTYQRCVGFLNDSVGWSGNVNPLYNDLLYKTTNGGTDWFVDPNVPDSSLSGACGIWVLNDTVIYICGTYSDNAGLLKTTNAGTSWKYINLKSYATGAVDLKFFSPDSGFVVGMDTTGLHAVILFTSDGGNSWAIKQTSNHDGEWAWKISFPTSSTGYVSIQNFDNYLHFLKTTDGGNTWTDLPFSAYTDFAPSGIGFVDSLTGWQGTHPWGTNGGMVETTDGGETWSINSNAKNVNKFRILNDTLAYACGESVYKYTTENVSFVSRNPMSNEISDFELRQNFPNPFNPLTAILFTIPSEQRVQLDVYDIKGELIKSIIDKILEPGGYEVRFMAKGLSSGVYLYTLKAGKFIQTKKMILLR